MKDRILVVDDEPAILLTTCAILQMKGYAVVSAASAREALAKLRAGSFDLVLTDMKMETETAGWDVVHGARTANPDAVVAVLTAYPSTCGNWCEEGAQALLEKPMRPQDLLIHVEKLIAEAQPRCARLAAA